MTSGNPTILLADDHTMFAEGLKSLLEDEFELLGTVRDGQALVEMARTMSPDIIIVDISMPVLNGFDAVRQLKKEGTKAKIIFLTMHGDDGLVAEAFRCGASGYVLKQSAGDELISAIKLVLNGDDYLPPLVTSTSARKPEPEDASHKLRLTPRQREVLRLIAKGQTMKEIGGHLGISTRTAESHKYEMMQGLGLESTAELIRYAIALGLVSE
ncbi:MAG: response regulator transcription factor [Pyrinomonadaceae bacterium]|nr:response regulator transcription factor [Pyrinomonadaceae bacterium]